MNIELQEDDRAMLTRWVKSRVVGDKQTLRARIVLMTADGCSTREIMETLKVSNPTLNLWRRRYQDSGIAGLKKGKTRPSRIPPLPLAKVEEVLIIHLAGPPTGCRVRRVSETNANPRRGAEDETVRWYRLTFQQ